jgi:hypothetical protein
MEYINKKVAEFKKEDGYLYKMMSQIEKDYQDGKDNCLYYKISDEEWTPLLDIGSLRFDNLQTESKTIIEAINELYSKLN